MNRIQWLTVLSIWLYLVATCLTMIFSTNLAFASAYVDPLSDPTVKLLRKYCRACHAVGERKFITSDNDQLVWDYIFQVNAPSNKSWAKSIVEVLEWPSPVPPPPGSQFAPGRQWMPIGSKRYEIVEEEIDGSDAREAILQSIKAGLSED